MLQRFAWTLTLLSIFLPASANRTWAQVPGSPSEPVKIDSDTIAGLGARCIGPAVMSGRIAAIDAVTDNGHLLIYVGSAGGGVWKSVNGGTTFKPIFDKYTQSIGAIAVDPSNHKTVWVGTGESWVRNSVSVGDGIYKTTDGGDTWQRMGLENSERIARIVVDQADDRTVYAAVPGRLWGSNPDRGIYKTTDGGKTWSKVLYVNPDTGGAWVAIDPQDSRIVYASMWQFRRRPYSFSSGGPGSGLFKSTDGGRTWKRLTAGLPEGNLGRIAVAVATSRPNRVYAVVEAAKSGLFRSDDLGETWQQVNDGQEIVARPFYFATLWVDPRNYNRLYKPATALVASEDGGKTFTTIGGNVHSDFHAMWINPDNPEQLLAGCDGGVYESLDRGNTWRFFGNLPVSQFYHVSFDMEQPYNVYGGLQDNSSWYGPSRATSGIQNRDWRSVYNGDGFWAYSDPSDPDYVYAEYQGGHLGRINRKTLEAKDIRPFSKEGEGKLRCNWNTPIVTSPNRKGTVYFGAQFLFRSRDHGETWERISPDLTTNDPKKQKQEESGGLTVDNSDAEAYTTIYTISESPKNGDMIWVGTDDGNVQLTRNGGKTWTNLVANIPRLPPNTWVSTIEASRFDEATAFATFDGHQNGDLKSYVYKTTDFGNAWTSLSTPDLSGYAHVIKQDLINRDLLFLGTESGLFVSLDGGKEWVKYKGGDFPPVAVRDLAIQPRESDLIVATHGRGIWIVDDINPLRLLDDKVLSSDAAFVGLAPAVATLPASEFGFNGDAEYVGKSASDSAVITYYQKRRHVFGDLRFEIYDSSGKLVSTVDGSKRRGLNRIEWAMRMKAPKLPPAEGLVENFYSLVGPRVLDGVYTVKMIKDKQTYTAQLKVVPDPRSTSTAADRVLQHQTVMRLYEMLGRLTYDVDSLIATQSQIRDRASKLSEGDAVRKQAEELMQRLEAVRSKLVATKEGGGGITGEEKIREQMGRLYGAVNGFDGRPTGSQIERTGALAGELSQVEADLTTLTGKDVARLNAALEKDGQAPVRVVTRQEWEGRQTGN